MSHDLPLARLLAARLCHDLGGAVAALEGTLALVEPDDPATLDLARETAALLRQRLRLYAAAWGEAGEDLDREGLLALLQGAPAAPRVRFALEAPAPGGRLPGALVPLVLNALLLAAEALPRGGTAHLAGDAARGLTVRPEGTSAAWPSGLVAALADEAPAALPEGGPRAVLVPLLLALARAEGWRLSLGLSAAPEGGCPLLLLEPA
ncbi:histidine phosphotransferase family protein [Crenalkalicoccus roseus]|uniref:histidine phosphotransferase family protein n=1 Tax=Crenalkalicoccus roseus TaxID=1485588 RepID=UPI0010818B3E|nr:histidine phosphotransferase family protein [Crenalkalicoccus roseus]